MDEERQFAKLLGRLNMSSKSVEVTIHHLVVHKDKFGQLMAQIPEAMGREKLNTRINICYFLKDLVNGLPTDLPLQAWLDQNLVALIDLAVPSQKIGSIALANVGPVRHALGQLRQTVNPAVHAACVAKLDEKWTQPPQGESEPLSKEDIIKRMEEDRERTKRIKEAKWQVVDDSEFDQLWSSLGALSELDRTRMKHQNELAVMSRS